MPEDNFGQKSTGGHYKATVLLGIPLVGAHLAQMSINVVDTLMLGWLGISELAAGTLAFQTFFLFMIFWCRVCSGHVAFGGFCPWPGR